MNKQVDEIETRFDENLGTFIVALPEFVTLEAMNGWEIAFIQAMEHPPGEVGLLFDTSSHNSESVVCYSWLKQFFTERANVGSQAKRVAFFQPGPYKAPQVSSEAEGDFLTVQKARKWVRQAR